MIEALIHAWTVGRCERAYTDDAMVALSMLPFFVVVLLGLAWLAKEKG